MIPSASHIVQVRTAPTDLTLGVKRRYSVPTKQRLRLSRGRLPDLCGSTGRWQGTMGRIGPDDERQRQLIRGCAPGERLPETRAARGGTSGLRARHPSSSPLRSAGDPAGGSASSVLMAQQQETPFRFRPARLRG